MFYDFEDDICFCLDSDNCDHTDCRRHDSNIKYKDIHHSYSYFKNTEYCKYSDPIPEEKLEYYKKYFNNRSNQDHPTSDQMVSCAIITNDQYKAKNIMKNLNGILISKTTDKIKWCVGDEEIWTWRKSYDNCLGNRFYKVIIDRRTDKDVFEKIILPCCANYCYSMDII